MKSNTNKKIIETITQNMDLFYSFDRVYLFGSVLNKEKFPNDIDILVIYSRFSSNILKDLNTIDLKLSTKCGYPIDLTALSPDEEKETDFLTKIGAYVRLK